MPAELTAEHKTYRYYNKEAEFEVAVVAEYAAEFGTWSTHVTLSAFDAKDEDAALAKLRTAAATFLALFEAPAAAP